MSFSASEVAELFRAGGPLAQAVPAYEPRQAQMELAREVGLVLELGGRLVAEAPTGVGKSLAYLLPSILWARSSGRPVVVATYTRALQDQLLLKESPVARRVAGGAGTVVTLKGRANYLCRRRLDRVASAAPAAQAALWKGVVEWAESTESGDLGEIDGIDPEAMAFVALRAGSDADFCASGRCSMNDGCFFKRARYRAAQSDVLVINHALLAIELLGEKGLLPEHGALIIDEAHHLEDAATRQMTVTVGARRLRSAGERSQGTQGDGVSALIRKVLDTWTRPEAEPRRQRLTAWQKAAGVAAARGELWFGRPNQGDEPAGGDTRRRYQDAGELKRLCPSDPTGFVGAVGEALKEGRAFLDDLSLAGPLSPDPERTAEAASELEGLLKEWEAIAQALDLALNPESVGSDWVHWKEWADRDSFNLVAAPANVSGPLGSTLRERYDRVVLTSATMTVAGDFGHVLRRLGLPLGTATLALESPFDFAGAVRLLSVIDGPDPRDAGYAGYLALALGELTRATRRKTLALFTSYALLREVLTLVKVPLEDEGIKVSAQGRDGAASVLLRKFRRPGAALLLGTASFWEGIDLPGTELELLVVTRLPFPVPGDPLVEARGEALRNEGRDPFMGYSVPEAVLKLRQGFGRLIRRQGDRGVVAILDGRFLSGRYAGTFQKALPVPVERCADVNALAERARDWMSGDRVTGASR